MPARTKPGEIWLVDLGLTAKVRPCVLLSDYPADDELALLVIVPHATAIRCNCWEFAVRLPFLREGAFHLQQVQPVSLARLERKLGELLPAHLTELRNALVRLLRLGAAVCLPPRKTPTRSRLPTAPRGRLIAAS